MANTRSKEQVSYFIADLHLAQNRPDITACFLSFLENEAVEAEKLYILGDLFEYWIGDDDNAPLVTEIATAIKRLSETNTAVFFIQGNRDFLLGRKYAEKCGMTLLNDVEKISLYNQEIVILHGDTLCTDDIDYQAFRLKSRSWWWQALIKNLPLFVRRKIAENYRKQSAQSTAMKSQEIMDVNQQAVVQCLTEHNVDLMIHGHTHRPAIHEIDTASNKATRVVLGDWYEQGAWLKFSRSGYELLNTPLSSNN